MVDGDTIEVLARPWPDQTNRATVRLIGVDAPEIRRAKCDRERDLGRAAAGFVARLVEGSQVWLVDPEPDPAFGTRPGVIRQTVMMYVRFPLSLRQFEDLLHERGIDIYWK